MNLFTLTAVTTGLTVFFSLAGTAAEPRKTRVGDINRPKAAPVPPAKLYATRMMLIDRKKALREQLQRSMTLQEEKIRAQSADYEAKRELFEEHLISRAELENSERILASTRLDTERIREWIAEDDRALSLVEEAADEDLQARSKAVLIRYDGRSSWTIDGLGKITRSFHERFGRPLPISAMGQSHTHDQLGLDHRGSVDVALRPDSAEGRYLMAYLRRTGIPFIAFRGKLSGVSTGAHIHIGAPSPSLSEIKRQLRSVPGREEGAKHG
jgi:hypothetical protein